MLVCILDQLVRRLLRLQCIDYDLGLRLFQGRGGLHVRLRQVLVKLGVKLFFGLLDEDEATDNSEDVLHRLFALVTHRARGELDKEIFDLAQIFTSRLRNKSPQKLD